MLESQQDDRHDAGDICEEVPEFPLLQGVLQRTSASRKLGAGHPWANVLALSRGFVVHGWV